MNITFSSFLNPLLQSAATLIILIPAILVFRPRSVDTAYTIAGGVYVLFILVNFFLYFPSNGGWRYFFLSMIATFVVMLGSYAIVNGFVRYVYKYDEAHESSMVFLVIMYHPLLLLFGMFCKWIFLKF